MSECIWTSPMTVLHGVGEKLAEKLRRCRIHQVIDLLFYLPYRYQDRTVVTPFAEVKHGEHAVVEGEVVSCTFQQARRAYWRVLLRDHTGDLELRFFHLYPATRLKWPPGVQLRCFGEVNYFQKKRSMIHPECERLDEISITPEARLTPLYPLIKGLQQKTFRQLTDQVLALIDEHPIPDYLSRFQWPGKSTLSLGAALLALHRPLPNQAALFSGPDQNAVARLSMEELLAQQLSMLRLRDAVKNTQAPACFATAAETAAFLATLPFNFTAAQARVADEIARDLQQTSPMMRLVQGDVGSGKTAVAAFAAHHVISAGLQVAIMAPTEVLALQHLAQFKHWFDPLSIETVLLSGQSKGSARKTVMNAIASGTAQCIVGTHALFQQSVAFHKLGLIIIDEQHRFGVDQRLLLREKAIATGLVPHQLMMTATPIPRTLTMTAFADLDVSIIDELPPGRKPITTLSLANDRRLEVIGRIQEKVRSGMQVYWVCTLIEESEVLQCQAAIRTWEQLSDALPGVRVSLVHGQMTAAEKEACLVAFLRHEADVLVATTVIEVGVNVPNANLMVIENAERLGLAQLHQLRGRVGRGQADSYCVLLYQAPLSYGAKQRIEMMRATQDGFLIAEKDLAIRGPGEVLGNRQSGIARMRIADLERDHALIPVASALAKRVMQEQPEVISPLIARWLQDKEKYVLS